MSVCVCVDNTSLFCSDCFPRNPFSHTKVPYSDRTEIEAVGCLCMPACRHTLDEVEMSGGIAVTALLPNTLIKDADGGTGPYGRRNERARCVFYEHCIIKCKT